MGVPGSRVPCTEGDLEYDSAAGFHLRSPVSHLTSSVGNASFLMSRGRELGGPSSVNRSLFLAHTPPPAQTGQPLSRHLVAPPPLKSHPPPGAGGAEEMCSPKRAWLIFILSQDGQEGAQAPGLSVCPSPIFLRVIF